MTLIVIGPESRRSKMTAHRAALHKALAAINLFDVAEDLASDPATPAATRIALRSVAVFERTHPDVDLWAPLVFGDRPNIDGILDHLFLLAMAFDARDDAGAAKAVAALQAVVAAA